MLKPKKKLEENHFEIENLCFKSVLGQKIGQILFDKTIEIGEKEFRICLAWCLGRKSQSYKILRKNGFEIFGKHDFVLGEDVQTDLLMKMKI